MWGSAGLVDNVEARAGFSLQTLEQQLAKNNELKAIAKEGKTITSNKSILTALLATRLIASFCIAELLAREALQEQVWQQTERLAKAEQRVIEMVRANPSYLTLTCIFFKVKMPCLAF